MRKYLKFTVTGVLLVVIALSAAYVLLNQPTANSQDERSLSLGDNSIITGPAGVPMANAPDAIYPHQYYVLFNVDSYMLLYNNSTSQYVADLELISGTLSNATAVALVRFSRDTNLPQDTYGMVNGVLTFTTYRQFDDLNSILSSLQNKGCTVSFGMPTAGGATGYGPVGFSILIRPTAHV
jgi:hypothetical protein